MREEITRFDGEQGKPPFKWNAADSSITDADGYTVLVVGGLLKNGQVIADALNTRANTRDQPELIGSNHALRAFEEHRDRWVAIEERLPEADHQKRYWLTVKDDRPHVATDRFVMRGRWDTDSGRYSVPGWVTVDGLNEYPIPNVIAYMGIDEPAPYTPQEGSEK